MQTFEYCENGASPTLFSTTKGLEFRGPDGHLSHRILNPGPRGFRVVSVTSSGHSAGFVEAERTAITLPVQGHADVRVGKRDFSVWPGDMVALGPSERHSHLRRDEDTGVYESFTIITPPKWSYGLPEDALYRSPDPKRLKLAELLRFSFNYLSNPELVSDRTVLLHEALVEDALVAALTNLDDEESHIVRHERYESLVRAVERYIDENYAEAISSTQLETAIEIPQKTLQRAFRARRGITIRSYLTRVRLDAMRRALEGNPETTSVTSAAVDAGLFHVGRASMAYRERFGELPSETLHAALRQGSDRVAGGE